MGFRPPKSSHLLFTSSIIPVHRCPSEYEQKQTEKKKKNNIQIEFMKEYLIY